LPIFADTSLPPGAPFRPMPPPQAPPERRHARSALFASLAAVWRQVSQDLPPIHRWTPRSIAAVGNQVTGFRLLADGLYRPQDAKPAP
jgi:hypothetical protein